MLHRVTFEKRSYVFSCDSEPALTVQDGDELVFETVDARGGRAMSIDDPYVVPPPPRYDRINPVTGPVAIVGAKAGGTLSVEVEEINLGTRGYISIRDDEGVLKDLVSYNDAIVVRVENDRVSFSPSIAFSARPMIGTIGVAPAGTFPSVQPGSHGGNMDCNEIKTGSKVYLPIRTDGAFVALGDVHASMGDGETSGAGIDIGADVKVRVRVLEKRANRGSDR